MTRKLFAALTLCCALIATASAQAPPATPAPAPAPAKLRPLSGRIAVFNAAKVLRDYKKWNYFSKNMSEKRNAAMAELGKTKNTMTEMQQKIQIEPSKEKQEQMAKQLVEMNRQLEDRTRVVEKQINDEAAAIIRNLFMEVQTCVNSVVEANNYDIVFSYPDAYNDEERATPAYFEMKLRPNAAVPFNVHPHADITQILCDTLNKYFPAPAEPVTAAGATAPAGPAK